MGENRFDCAGNKISKSRLTFVHKEFLKISRRCRSVFLALEKTAPPQLINPFLHVIQAL